MNGQPPRDRALAEQQQQERNEAMIASYDGHGDIITEDDIELWIKEKEKNLERQT